MQAIISIIAAFTLIFGGQWLVAKYREWMDSLPVSKQEKIKYWFWLFVWCLSVIAVAFGIQYDVLNYGAWAIPGTIMFPFLLGILTGWWNSWKLRGQRLTDKHLTSEANAAELFKDAVIEIGCQPSVNDDGTMELSYQGENFHIEFGGRYARIWDPMWAGIKVDDPDFQNIREAVNCANFQFGPTVVMTSPDENGVIGFHSHRQVMLHPACPENAPYIKAVLDSFFETKENVRASYQQLAQAQVERQKNRRPVGFNTNQNLNKTNND